jgi:SAM-dependent methyltransferase
MKDLPFGREQFDLIWSEGAIYIMGFEQGLRAWKVFCKKGGHIVVSDCAWFEQNPPASSNCSGKKRDISLCPKTRRRNRFAEPAFGSSPRSACPRPDGGSTIMSRCSNG